MVRSFPDANSGQRVSGPGDPAAFACLRAAPWPMSNAGTQFEYQPVLDGSLLSLRPLRAEDFDALYTVAADPLIWEQHPASNRHERPVFQSFFGDALASGGALVAIERATGEVIGSSRFHAHDATRSTVEIGWTFLARRCWGGRYNGEMKRLMISHAHRFVRHAIFLIGISNFRSQRAIEKIGGERVGNRADPGGHDSYVYQISS